MGGTLQAQLFLMEFQNLISGNQVRLSPRNDKTWDFLLEYRLREADVLGLLRLLKPEHYQWGPEPDDNGTQGDVMCFIMIWEGILLYIKLKTWKCSSGKRGSIMSIHEEGMHNV